MVLLTPTLIYESLSYHGLTPELQEYQSSHLPNIICSCASYVHDEFGITFEHCATILFVLAFGYQSQTCEWYEIEYWKKAFDDALSDPLKLGLSREAQIIVKHFQTHHLRVVLEFDLRTVKVVINFGGERPRGRELTENEQAVTMRIWPSAVQRYQDLDLLKEFEIQIIQGRPGFMIEPMFVVAIMIVGVILIFACSRGRVPV